MRKSLIIASTLALSLGVVSAQTQDTPTTPTVTQPDIGADTADTQPTLDIASQPASDTAVGSNAVAAASTASQVVSFTDVPAGHWAKDAVDVITQRGLIQGFPDGSFRGSENLTRYQAALIFYRLLQSGALGNGSLSQGDLTTVAGGMQEVSTELAAISTRIGDLETLTGDQQTRLTALEQRISDLGDTGAGADTDLTARIDALEAAVRNIPTGGADTSALEARVAALEERAAGTTDTATTPAITDVTDTTGLTDTTTQTPTTVIIGDDTTVAVAPARANFYAGITASASNFGSNSGCILGTSGNRQLPFCAAFGGVVGTQQVFGPVGARVGAELKPSAGNAISADVKAMYHLNSGGRVQPYVGLGLGLTNSHSATVGETNNVTDGYAAGALGADFGITNNISLFAEANGRYYFSARGLGAGAAKTVVPSAKAGLKFHF